MLTKHRKTLLFLFAPELLQKRCLAQACVGMEYASRTAHAVFHSRLDLRLETASRKIGVHVDACVASIHVGVAGPGACRVGPDGVGSPAVPYNLYQDSGHVQTFVYRKLWARVQKTQRSF